MIITFVSRCSGFTHFKFFSVFFFWHVLDILIQFHFIRQCAALISFNQKSTWSKIVLIWNGQQQFISFRTNVSNAFFIEKYIRSFIITISTINSTNKTFITKFEWKIDGKKQLAEWMIQLNFFFIKVNDIWFTHRNIDKNILLNKFKLFKFWLFTQKKGNKTNC